MKARLGMHYHVLIYSDETMVYEYNGWDPEPAIEQFSAAIEGVMQSDYEEIKEHVTMKVALNLESEEAEEEYSLVMETDLYNAMFVKCFSLCPVSPSMN